MAQLAAAARLTSQSYLHRLSLRLAQLVAAARRTWQSYLRVPVLRLAPLALLLVVVLLATSSVVALAQSSLPGDPAYLVKEWMRAQRLGLAPANLRESVRQLNQEQVLADVGAAARRLIHENNLEEVAPRAKVTMIYHGQNGKLLRVGDLMVAPNYQPRLTVEEFLPMQMDDGLQPGDQVELEFQVLPGNPGVVQGIALRIVVPNAAIAEADGAPGATGGLQATAARVGALLHNESRHAGRPRRPRRHDRGGVDPVQLSARARRGRQDCCSCPEIFMAVKVPENAPPEAPAVVSPSRPPIVLMRHQSRSNPRQSRIPVRRRRPTADRRAGRRTDRRAGRRTDRAADRRTDRAADRRTDRAADRRTHRAADR